MKKNPKIIMYGLLSLILVASMVGCGTKNDANDPSKPLSIHVGDETETPSSAQEPGKPSTISDEQTKQGSSPIPSGSQKASSGDGEASLTKTPGSGAASGQATGIPTPGPDVLAWTSTPDGIEAAENGNGTGDDFTPGAIPTATPPGESVTLKGQFLSEGGKYYLLASTGKIELIADEEMLVGPDGTISYIGKSIILSGEYRNASKTMIKVNSLMLEQTQTGDEGGGAGSIPTISPQTTREIISGIVIKKSDGSYQLKKEGTSQTIELFINADFFDVPEGTPMALDGQRVQLEGYISGGKFYVTTFEFLQ